MDMMFVDVFETKISFSVVLQEQSCYVNQSLPINYIKWVPYFRNSQIVSLKTVLDLDDHTEPWTIQADVKCKVNKKYFNAVYEFHSEDKLEDSLDLFDVYQLETLKVLPKSKKFDVKVHVKVQKIEGLPVMSTNFFDSSNPKADVEICIDDYVFYAQKNILRQSAVLEKKMKDKSRVLRNVLGMKRIRLTLSNESPRLFLQILQSLYEWRFELTEKNLRMVLETAHRYEVPHVISRCEQFILFQIDRQMAKTLEMTSFRQTMKSWFLKNIFVGKAEEELPLFDCLVEVICWCAHYSMKQLLKRCILNLKSDKEWSQLESNTDFMRLSWVYQLACKELFEKYQTYQMVVGHQVSFPLYENWLENLKEKHNSSSFQWVQQNRHFPLNEITKSSRELDEIRRSVIESHQVQEAIDAEVQSRKCTRDEVVTEVYEILDIMSHKFQLSFVRLFGCAIGKGLQNIFDGVYVNAEHARRIREITKTRPVVFMPSHRTYLDFLLLSVICFEYEIPLPAIAAGMDFMNSPLMGGVLRRCGAFFMRRSFGKDRLYWAVFSEYVQNHLVKADRPVEFFVEGTRSRVGKSLHPKYGLLQIALAPYLKGDVFDITVVPVSMNYDKILEESLYAYELLGFPKPKESTSGLFKARDIFNKNFGRCFITFSDPISVRELFGKRLQSTSFVSQPSSQFVLEENAKRVLRKFGHQVVKANDRNSIITVWPVACMAMLHTLDSNDDEVFTFSALHQHVKYLIDLLEKLDVIVTINQSLGEDLSYYIKLHDDLFHPIAYGDDYELRLKDFPIDKDGFVERDIMKRAVSRLILTTYSNVMIHGVVEIGYLAVIMLQLGLRNIHGIKEKFFELVQLLKREFVCVPEEEEKMFEEALTKLRKSSIIGVSNEKMQIKGIGELETLRDIIMPYICHFHVVLMSILDSQKDALDIPSLVKTTQQEIVRRYELGVGIPVRLSFLSTEPIKNTFYTLLDMKCLEKKGDRYTPIVKDLVEILNKTAQYTGQNGVDEFIVEEAKL
ncbi:unnamed protein product [Auanema sp. JU1783]|nr:unnamed protein product [Auanema sp. JU1783]